MVQCDCHVHSKYSSAPTNWLTKKFGCPESFTEPKTIYKTAMDRGMTHVTITDHNTINGCKELVTLYDNTFLSCEVTTRFPQDRCKVHVLVYNISERQYEEIMKLRSNIYKFVDYLDHENIWNAIAHPMYSVNDMLTQNHLEQLLIMFDLIELNGFKSNVVNSNIKYIIENLTDEILIKLSYSYKINNPKLIASNKNFIRGSDDHSGIFIAENYTLNKSGDEFNIIFENPQHNVMMGANATAKELSYALYSISYQFFSNKMDVKKYVSHNSSFNTIDKMLTLNCNNKITPISLLSEKIKYRMNETCKGNGDIQSILMCAIKNLSKVENVNPKTIASEWFNVVATISNDSIKLSLDYLIEKFNHGDIFNILKSLNSLPSLYFLLLPYYIGYYIFQQTRNFSQNINIEGISTKQKKVKIVNFTDTFYEINGVANTLRSTLQCSKQLGYDYTIITCHNTESRFGEVVFKPIKVYDLPEYPELKLPCPSILDMLEYCYKENFTHYHISTPGTIGLVGLLISKILQKPVYTTYHTAYPEFVEAIIGERMLTNITKLYVKWFCNLCDKVFTNSDSFGKKLIDYDIDKNKIFKIPRGVDVDFYRQRPKNKGSKINLLYVGRISKEKNLDVLSKAFAQLNLPNTTLTIVGDGPYKKELELQLQDYPVRFTGYLEDSRLLDEYHNSDFFVFPSTNDTFGNVVLEAFACGLPVIVTDAGGPSENVIQGKTGIIVKANDVNSLKEGINTMTVMGKDKLYCMGLDARKHVETRSFEKEFIKLMSFYE